MKRRSSRKGSRQARIGWKLVLEHVRAMEHRIDAKFVHVYSLIESLSMTVRGLSATVDRHHAQTMMQLTNIDARLDDIEVRHIPAMKKAMGMA